MPERAKALVRKLNYYALFQKKKKRKLNYSYKSLGLCFSELKQGFYLSPKEYARSEARWMGGNSSLG